MLRLHEQYRNTLVIESKIYHGAYSSQCWKNFLWNIEHNSVSISHRLGKNGFAS